MILDQLGNRSGDWTVVVFGALNLRLVTPKYSKSSSWDSAVMVEMQIERLKVV